MSARSFNIVSYMLRCSSDRKTYNRNKRGAVEAMHGLRVWRNQSGFQITPGRTRLLHSYLIFYSIYKISKNDKIRFYELILVYKKINRIMKYQDVGRENSDKMVFMDKMIQ